MKLLSWRFLLLASLAWVGVLTLVPQQAHASHYRGGQLTYKQISGNTIEVTLEIYIRRTFWQDTYGQYCAMDPVCATCDQTGTCGTRCCFTDPVQGPVCVCARNNCGTSSCVNEVLPIGGTFNWGDGTTFNTSAMRVFLEDKTNDIFGFRATYRHTYSTSGTKTVTWGSCCWIGGIVPSDPIPGGGSVGEFQLSIKAQVGTNNNAPSYNSPFLFKWCEGKPYTQNLNPTDPDGDSVTVAATQTVTGDVFSRGLTVSSKGILNWPNPQRVPIANTNPTQYLSRFVVRIRATDSKGATTDRDFLFELVGVCSNKDPQLALSKTAVTTKVGQQVCIDVTGSDPDTTDKIKFRRDPDLGTAAPTGEFQTSHTWQYCYTPTAADEGKTIQIVFTVTDNASPAGFSQKTLTITVQGSRPPTITVTPSGVSKTVDEGKELKFTVKATDVDSSIDTFTLTGLPSFCTQNKIDASTIEVTCKPGFSDGTKDYKLTFNAKDKDPNPKSSSLEITIKVNDVNRPPNVTDPGAQTIDEDKPFSLTIQANDPDGDTLTYSMTGLPAGAKIDPTTGEITWTPAQKDVGEHTATVTVTDSNGAKTTVTIKFTVKNVNDNPVFTSTPPGNVQEKTEYKYTPTVTDEDPGDEANLKYKFGKDSSGKDIAPPGATIDPDTGEVKWTPGTTDSGKEVDFEIEVCDPQGGCTKQSWKTKVTNTNDPPKFTSTPPKVAYIGEDVNYQPTITDPDTGDTHTYRLKNGPAGMTVDPNTGKVSWKPDPSDKDKEVDVEIEVCDSANPPECDSQKFKLKVKQRCKVDVDCSNKEICIPDPDNASALVCVDPGCATQDPKCSANTDFCKDGKCDKDPCDGKTCGSGEVCRPSDGKCIKPCAGVTCQAGEMCVDGTCEKDPCAASPCQANEYCDTSGASPTCVTNPCQSGSCKHGRVCLRERCIDDPCSKMQCPDPKQLCLAGQCVDRKDCEVDVNCPSDEICVGKKCYPSGCYTKNPQCENKPNVFCTDGNCKDDVCAGANPKQCGQDEFCRPEDGVCAGTCAGVNCKDTEKCVDGKCVNDPCKAVTCNAGKVCIDGDCQTDNCSGATDVCKHGRICNQLTNGCTNDPCKGVKCPGAKQVCRFGQCLPPPSCKFDEDCPDTQICVQGKCVVNGCNKDSTCDAGLICDDGKCLGDPCKDKKCENGQYCKQGNCVSSCAGVFCKDGERCVDGSCTSDPCAGKTCNAGEKCRNGNCVQDECKTTSCKDGRLCLLDYCDDDPCKGITCPDGQTCKDGQCTGTLKCKYDKDCPGSAVCVNQGCLAPGCYTTNCQNAELCLDAACKSNPCDGKVCDAGSSCRPADGTCVKNCPKCADGERCKEGKCEADPCKDVSCGAGQTCKDGTCADDPCADQSANLCKYQRVCKGDSCADDPCLNVNCPAGSTCRDGVCYSTTVSEPAPEPKPEPGPEPVVDTNVPDAGPVDRPPLVVSGGCGCQIQNTNPLTNLFTLFLFLALLFAVTRRRVARSPVRNRDK